MTKNNKKLLMGLLVISVLLASMTAVFGFEGRTLAKYNSDLDAKLASDAKPWDKPLMPAFMAASKEYRVPLPLLLTLAYFGSAFENRGGAPTIEGGYGVMALRDNVLGGESLALGSSLTAAGTETLRCDPEANIRAAAAVIADYGGTLRQRRSQGLDGWLSAVVKYAALDPECSRFFAMEVYQKLQAGLDCTNSAGERFCFGPQSIGKVDLDSLKPKGTKEITIQSTDYGPAIWDPAASCNYTATVTSKDTIAIHTIEGSAAGAVSWFKNCAAQVSSHYVIGENGTVWQCVREQYRAWHVGCYNSRSIGFEHEGYAGSPSHPTTLYNASAGIAREICNERGIPKAHTGAGPGIMGHNDINVICGGDHWDPGGGWDWNYYISQVNGGQFAALSVGRNADGRLEVFARGTNSTIYHNYQDSGSPGGWSGWWSMGGSGTDAPQVGTNTDGRMEVFVKGTDNQVWRNWQLTPSGGWSGWYAMGGLNGWIAESPVVGRNADGRLELFGRGGYGMMCHNWRNANGTWSGWYDMGYYAAFRPAVIMNTTNCQELFVRTTEASNSIYHAWQLAPNAGWSGWYSLGGGLLEGVAVIRNVTGIVEIFARGGGGTIYHNWQYAGGPGGWAGWYSMGGVGASMPSVGMNADGRAEAFVRGTNNQVYHAWQNNPGGSAGWSGWYSLGGSGAESPIVGTNTDGRMELFLRGTDGLIYHSWQSAPNGGWSAWFPL